MVTREVLLSILRPADSIWGYLWWMLHCWVSQQGEHITNDAQLSKFMSATFWSYIPSWIFTPCSTYILYERTLGPRSLILLYIYGMTFKHFITSIALRCHFVTGDHNFLNSKVMATSIKSRGHEFYIPSHHQFQTAINHFENSCLAYGMQWSHSICTIYWQKNINNVCQCVLLWWHGYIPLLGTGLMMTLIPLHWLKKWMTSTTRLGRRTHHEHIFLRVMTTWHIMWWGYQLPRVWRRGHASQSSHHQLSQLAHRWHRPLWSECDFPFALMCIM